MVKRVLTALIGIPLLIFIINSGGIIFFVSLSVVTLIGLWEFIQCVNKSQSIKINYILELLLGGLLLLAFYFNMELLPLIIFLFIAISIYEIILGHRDILSGIYSIFGLMYIPLLLGHLLLFDGISKGIWFLWLVFIISFSTDTFAYFVGISFGKHKLSPIISPKKSIEGSIGGIVGSVIVTMIYGYFLNKYNSFDIPLYYFAIIAFITSIISQFGDLTASLIKRSFGVKDFGNLLPGHGGILDRFDSIIFAAPTVYYIVVYSLKGVIF